MARTQVVVVGGGIVGCSCACELARNGARVRLYERADFAAGASSKNHGLLLAPLEAALVPMARASDDLYREVASNADLPVDLDVAPVGFLIAARDEREADGARAEAEAAGASGVPVERLGAEEVRRLEPSLAADVSEAWLLQDGRRVDATALTVALGHRAALAGAELYLHTTVRGLLRKGDAVRGIVTDRGPVDTDLVVLAAGTWSPGLARDAGVDLPVVGARGWLVQLRPPPGLLGHIVGVGGWHPLPGHAPIPPLRASEVAEGADRAFSSTLLQPSADGTMLAGGSRQAAVTFEPEDAGMPRRILSAAIRLVPALADVPVLSAWWGLRPMSPDARPIVGMAADGLLVATGHGSQGVILGGGTARLVAALALGEQPPFDPSPFAPSRFGPSW